MATATQHPRASTTQATMETVSPPQPTAASPFSPIHFIYTHLHNAIRAELDFLGQQVLALEPTLDGQGNNALEHHLTSLGTRYKFLTNVYKYHSSVEDEVRSLDRIHDCTTSTRPNAQVIYPALDSKVRNVTLSYRVEHEDEERLFEQLVTLIATALAATGAPRNEAVRELVCKVEEVHTMLRKHLRKEEEQLLPLLLHHFTVDEQAQLIAQSLCCIPLATVGVVLSWVKATMTQDEQHTLLQQVQHAMAHDEALLQLLEAWLALDNTPVEDVDNKPVDNVDSAQNKGCKRPASSVDHPEAKRHRAAEMDAAGKPPLRDILYLHQAIRSALDAFVADAQLLLHTGTVSPPQLSSLVDKHRFLRAICTCHSASEEEAVFPAARQLHRTPSDAGSHTGCPDTLPGFCDECEEEHAEEASLFEDLGRLLGDVKASTRRGAKNASALTQQLCRSALAVRDAVGDHLRKEEANVFPVLESRLGVQEQRALVWHAMRAMPLRLIQRVVPAMAGSLSVEEVNALVNNFRLAAPLEEAALVDLLSRWTSQSAGTRPPSGPTATTSAAAAVSAATHIPAPASPSSPPAAHPIDHIFQFHKALRRDMRTVEAAALQLDGDVQATASWTFDARVQDLEGRFTFLWGIYQAHSKAEDEIVFPALERKEATHNISHAYTLDHQQEGQYFSQVEAVFRRMRETSDVDVKRTCVGQLRRMCASIRASVETHVRAEENELWPVFVEHFTIEEQQALVGQIIGRTGAQVLQVMLPWVTGSFTPEEEEAMMHSLRTATKNTMFSNWLEALEAKGSRGEPSAAADGTPPLGAPPPRPPPALDPQVLRDISRYIPEQQPGALVSDSQTYVPGWNDIFRMNEQQLQGAIRRVCNDPSLEPQRKSYLVQHIMTSRYIASQQRRMADMYGLSTASLPLDDDGRSAAPAPAPTDRQPAAPVHVPAAAASVSTSAAVSMSAAPSHATYHSDVFRSLGCKHYRCGARLVAPCCGREVTCRLCHDELVSDHRMDRYEVTEMVCMHCALRQPVAQDCHGCGRRLAAYYCDICHLFDDEPGRDIYHCPFCNVCRRGKGLGVDFFHCMTCNSCMSLDLHGNHTCREKSLEGTCPVCSDFLFDSNLTVKELPCGHFMHSTCFAAYTRHSYTCPICSRSLGDMRVYWRMLDSLLASEQDAMPPELATRTQAILCNDCGKQGEAPFHFVYHRCSGCNGYNTRVTGG